MHSAAPDRYRGLLEQEKPAGNLGEKALNAKSQLFSWLGNE